MLLLLAPIRGAVVVELLTDPQIAPLPTSFAFERLQETNLTSLHFASRAIGRRVDQGRLLPATSKVVTLLISQKQNMTST
jgi:hypothetical protein